MRYHICFTLVSTIFIACSMPTNDPVIEQGASAPLALGPSPSEGSAVAQLFDWPFRAIEGELCALREDGYSHVHVSPPQQSNRSDQWWGRYQPDDYRTLRGPLGDELDFRDMVAEGERCDIDIVVDVVLNHMANFNLAPSDLYYPSGCDRRRPLSSGPGSCLFAPDHFYQARCIGDYGNACDVLSGRICGGGGDRGLPDLRTGECGAGGFDPYERNYDPHVFAMAKNYLRKLQALGARSFRIDAAKHIHPAFLRDLLGDPEVAAETEWVYAEIITERANDPILSAYRSIPKLDFMDFPLTRALSRATGYGGSLGDLEFAVANRRGLPGSASVAFVTNHDVWGNESGLGYRFGGSERFADELLAHAFVLGREEGIPYIYTELPERSQSRRYRDEGTSYVHFHRRPGVRAMSRFHARMLGMPTRYRWQDDAHLAFARGEDGFVALNKARSPWPMRSIDAGIPDGRFQSLLDGQSVEVRGGRIQAEVPGRSALVLERSR